jgi:hypothetical protein
MLIKTFWLLKKLSVCKKKFVATKVVIRNQNLKNIQYNDQKEKDKQYATKHYSEKLKIEQRKLR